MKKIIGISIIIILSLMPVSYGSLFPWPVTDIIPGSESTEVLDTESHNNASPVLFCDRMATSFKTRTCAVPQKLQKAYTVQTGNVIDCVNTELSANGPFAQWMLSVSFYFYMQNLRNTFPFNY